MQNNFVDSTGKTNIVLNFVLFIVSIYFVHSTVSKLKLKVKNTFLECHKN